MQFEVYTGARPGKPRLALVISAVMLAGVLGLAWIQARDKSALGPAQRVGDSPVWIRPPRDWRADPEDPYAIILPAREEGWRRRVFPFERRIRLEWERLPTFRPLEDLLRLKRLDDPRSVDSLRASRIGPFDALEVHKFVPKRIGRSNFLRETIVRITCLPRGHVLTVEYDPLIDIRPADLEILEDVSASLRIDDRTLSGPPDAFLRQAGVDIPLEPGWQVVGADFPEVPGVFVGGSLNGVPRWSLGVFRTWLAPGRTVEDVLADFAAEHWQVWDIPALLAESTGADGSRVTTLRHPASDQAATIVPSVRFIDRAPGQRVLLYLFTGAPHVDAADRIASDVAHALRVLPLETLPDLPAAIAAGESLATTLAQHGAVSRWGRGSKTTYTGNTPGGRVALLVSREARGRNAERGYEGLQLAQREGGRNGRREERTWWSLDGGAQAYEWQSDFYLGQEQVYVRERRITPDGPVTRTLQIDDTPPRRTSFTPGPAFVPPPAETVVEGWVARGEAPAALVERSAPFGTGTHTALLRHLPPEGDRTRVLIQLDFWPLGQIEVFDETRNELEAVIFYPEAVLRRVGD